MRRDRQRPLVVLLAIGALGAVVLLSATLARPSSPQPSAAVAGTATTRAPAQPTGSIDRPTLSDPGSASTGHRAPGPTATASTIGSPGPSGSDQDPAAPALTPGPSRLNVYAAMSAGLDPRVAGIRPRVYVPDEVSGTVVVIDPLTFKIIDRFSVGQLPHHISPSWDLRTLYVNDMESSRLTEINPVTGKVVGSRSIPSPYNLYFTPDGSKAIVVAEPLNRLDFYDRRTWRLLRHVTIPHAGPNHLDFSADGHYLLLSTEFAGYVVKVDTVRMRVSRSLRVGGQPIDVKLSPDGAVFFVANMARGGVSIIDPRSMREIAFLRTGNMAHGMAVSRDTTRLYVTNRGAGTISVIDFGRRRVVATWKVGLSPDMITLSADGRQLWTSDRFDGRVTVVDTTSGRVIKVIKVDAGPHGLTFFPQPGHISLGHNGVYR